MKKSYKFPKNPLGITQLDILDDEIELIITEQEGESIINITHSCIETLVELNYDDAEPNKQIHFQGMRIPYYRPSRFIK